MKIKEDHLQIFIPYKGTYDYYLSKTDSLKIVDLVGVVLDENTIESIKWHNYHAFENDQIGLIGMLDIQELARGELHLTIFKKRKYQDC